MMSIKRVFFILFLPMPKLWLPFSMPLSLSASQVKEIVRFEGAEHISRAGIFLDKRIVRTLGQFEITLKSSLQMLIIIAHFHFSGRSANGLLALVKYFGGV